MTRNEASILVNDILEDINNWLIKVSRSSCSVKYSLCGMQNDLSQFIDRGKGYKMQRNYQIQLYPSISSLKALKKIIPEEGTFPMLYSQFSDSLQNSNYNTKDFIGMALMDRMK